MKPTKTAKMLMSRKRRIPVSADGVRLRRGSEVFCIWTQNGGKTWHVASKTVQRTDVRGMVSFEDPPCAWHYAWPLDAMVGDHRIYGIEANAKAECQRRNRAAKRK